MISYFASAYIVTVGYLYPLIHFLYQTQEVREDIASTSAREGHFIGRDWSQLLASLTLLHVFNSVLGPFFSIVLFPWYTVLHMAAVTCLVTIKNSEKFILVWVGSQVLSNKTGIQYVEDLIKVHTSTFYKTWLMTLWNRSLWVYSFIQKTNPETALRGTKVAKKSATE